MAGQPARPSLRELTAASPGLRAELGRRARDSGLLVACVAVLVAPAWTVVDRLLAPEQAMTFLAVRLGCDLPMLAGAGLLWRHRVGRRHPELLAFLVLAVVQAEVAWMVPRVDQVHYYLLGLTLALYGSGCVLVSRPRWTAALAATTCAALGLSLLTAPSPMGVGDLVATGVYLGTASLIAMIAHSRRYTLGTRELSTRIRLEREQERTRVLLARLDRLSHEDPLTGLGNRRRWDAALASACAEARREATPVAVVLVDLDRFKQINDRHGHPGGDLALRQVAALLSASVRSGDLVARLGGDELAVLLPGADGDRALSLAERLCRDAAQLRPPGFAAGEISLSLGVACAAGDEASPAELLARADQQLYRAKATRNAVGLERGDLVAEPG